MSAQEVKLAWRDLAKRDVAVEELFTDLIVAQRDISFQDMQSITRAFKEHLRVDLVKAEDTNDIILGQAARHVIVHAGGFVDSRMSRQVSGAHPRQLKPELHVGSAIEFSPTEVRHLSASMLRYVDALIAAVEPLWAEVSTSA